MALDQEDRIRALRDDLPDCIRDRFKPSYLIRYDLTRAGSERDAVDIDAANPLAQRRIVANLVERVGALDRFQRRRRERFVQQRWRRGAGIDDVAIARDAHDWR